MTDPTQPISTTERAATLGRGRMVLGALGVVLIGFGGISVLLHLFGRLPQLVLWLAVPVAVHDGLLVPVTLALAWLGRRFLPRAAWGPVVIGLVVSGTLLALALPALLSPAAGQIPGLLNRDYGQGLVLSLAITWVAVAALAIWTVIRRRRRSG